MDATAIEVEQWLGGAWSPGQTEELVQHILETGSDAEADWVRVTTAYDGVGHPEDVVLEAAARDYDRAAELADTAQEGALAAAAADYERATAAADTARDGLRTAVRTAVAAGMSEAEAARQAGVTRMTVRSWIGK